MKTWICPKCQYEIGAIATAVAHSCPNNRRIWTNFVEKPDTNVVLKVDKPEQIG